MSTLRIIEYNYLEPTLGILEREQEQSVVYGSIDFGKTVVTHAKYMDLLQKAGSQLKILPHTVINDKEEEVI